MKENKSKVIITSIVTVFPMVIGFLLWNRLPERLQHISGVKGQMDGVQSCLQW